MQSGPVVNLGAENDTNPVDPFPTDNLNVIYDNDTAITGSAYEKSTGDSSKGQTPPMSENNGTFELNLRNKHANNNVQSGFINMDQTEPDETNKNQDNFATCLLASIRDGKAIGRLNFWQPKENRGAAHLIARFRYPKGEYLTRTNDKLERKRRESFSVPIEGETPQNMMDNCNQVTMHLLKHKIWLRHPLNDTDCSSTIEPIRNNNSTILMSELKVPSSKHDSDELVDLDAETIIGKSFHLAGDESFVGRCIALTVSMNSSNKSDESENDKNSEANIFLATCKVTSSSTMPSNDHELDHSPSVSVVQPIREDLLLQQQTVLGRRKI